TRPCGATAGGGNTTLLFTLPPGYTFSKNRFCSVSMMPPRKNINFFENKNTYEENGKVFSKFTRNIFALAGTQRGVCNYLAPAGKTGDIPFQHGRERFD